MDRQNDDKKTNRKERKRKEKDFKMYGHIIQLKDQQVAPPT